MIYFNPRTREGCDISHKYFSFDLCCISIHAPVKGATQYSDYDILQAINISIHAPVKGATCYYMLYHLIPPDFNPRTREGCDPSDLDYQAPAIVDFNPRTREGCDGIQIAKLMLKKSISIHAPVKGATK